MMRLFCLALITVSLLCSTSEAACGLFGGNGFLGVRGRMAGRREARQAARVSCGQMAPVTVCGAANK